MGQGRKGDQPAFLVFAYCSSMSWACRRITYSSTTLLGRGGSSHTLSDLGMSRGRSSGRKCSTYVNATQTAPKTYTSKARNTANNMTRYTTRPFCTQSAERWEIVWPVNWARGQDLSKFAATEPLPNLGPSGFLTATPALSASPALTANALSGWTRQAFRKCERSGTMCRFMPRHLQFHDW